MASKIDRFMAKKGHPGSQSSLKEPTVKKITRIVLGFTKQMAKRPQRIIRHLVNAMRRRCGAAVVAAQVTTILNNFTAYDWFTSRDAF